MGRYRFEPDILAGMEAAPVPFAVYQFIDRRVVTVALSGGFCELFGYEDRAQAYYDMDNDMYKGTYPEDIAAIADAAVRFATEDGEYNVVYRTRTNDCDDYIIVRAQGRHMYTESGVRLAYVWYTKEGDYDPEKADGADGLTQAFNQILREGSLAHQNRYDPLTGLPNMTYFFELAEAGVKRLRAEGRTAAILYIDLCGMKAFNNKWGFAGGDRLIQAFGHMLAAEFSSESCARFGQDHFAVFMDADGAEEKLACLFKACAALNGGISLPARVGICLVKDEQIEIGKACDRAKMACDANRRAFVSEYYYFDEKMLADAEKRQYVIDNLDAALEQGWVRVYYQPIVRAANGRVCDEEALSRWIDPEKGFLSPADFIPALEEARLIYKLDLYVVDKVLEKMKRQAEAGLYVVPQSVNLSRSDFDSCDIVEEIQRRVDASGIGRDKLTIEVTESVVGSDFEFMKAQVERFRALGFKVWMDDFGSGYSSLDVLQNIRFDLVKLDMRFMQQLDAGDEGKIILTELVKMMIGLGVDTVCEGVEREAQVEFLKEIGCTKLQGYYYCKPIPPEQIIERNRKGIQIGYENPDETDYYAMLGRVNLYDMSVIAGEDDQTLRHFFDTLPMAVIEVKGTVATYVRCNKAYRDFMERSFGLMFMNTAIDYADMPDIVGSGFVKAMLRCARDGNRVVLDEKTAEDTTVHSFVRRVAINPVTGTAAVVVAVLAITNKPEEAGTTYARIARSLSADYINLYYVNLETEQFIEYSSDALTQNLDAEQRGEDFFSVSRRGAEALLYAEDYEYFVSSFTREKVIRALDTQGAFTLTYRLMLAGQPTYVHMKAVRMQGDSAHIIIGVSNVDAQMRHRQELERMREERITFARVQALTGTYICIYTVNPETGRYVEYSATPDYDGLKVPREGEDFFDQVRRQTNRVVYSEDRAMVDAMLTRENVMREIERSGLFALGYRIVMNGAPIYINVKAALVEEKDGPQLIIGVNNVDAQVRREQALGLRR